jgi:hypothetical protein
MIIVLDDHYYFFLGYETPTVVVQQMWIGLDMKLQLLLFSRCGLEALILLEFDCTFIIHGNLV